MKISINNPPISIIQPIIVIRALTPSIKCNKIKIFLMLKNNLRIQFSHPIYSNLAFNKSLNISSSNNNCSSNSNNSFSFHFNNNNSREISNKSSLLMLMNNSILMKKLRISRKLLLILGKRKKASMLFNKNFNKIR